MNVFRSKLDRANYHRHRYDGICRHDRHHFDFVSVGPGVVYQACTKCPFWEPAKQSPIQTIITLYDADGNIVG